MSEFVKADARNLPNVDIGMVLEFCLDSPDMNINEVRGWKAGNSMRSSYINAATGWAEVKRANNICTVRAKMCPEHKINSSLYVVECEIDERKEKVLNVKCLGCAACSGTCKHATAFLGWLYEKSVSPSSTDVACYWKKPPLSRVNSNTVATLKDFKKITSNPIPNSHEVVELFISKLPRSSTVSCAQAHLESEFSALCMHRSALKFASAVTDQNRTFPNFLLYLCNTIQPNMCQEACAKTVQQSKSALWYTMRYGRISGSTLFDLSRAKNNDSLIDKILGASKVPLTDAIKRGKDLEDEVFKEACKELNVKFENSGFLVSHEMPHFGVSPDGISEEYVLEIKCPAKERTKVNYVKNGVIVPKVRAQIQLSMKLFGKKKGVLALADPNFTNNRKIELFFDTYDEAFLRDTCSKAEIYWSKKIFPLLIN